MSEITLTVHPGDQHPDGLEMGYTKDREGVWAVAVWFPGEGWRTNDGWFIASEDVDCWVCLRDIAQETDGEVIDG